MFAYRDTVDLGPGATRVEVAFTDASLDLQGGSAKREPFARALATLEAEVGVSFARLHQVHGDVVVEADEAWPPGNRGAGEVPVGDAIVTTRRGVGLMVRVADCVPVVLADPTAGVVGVVHAGRKGVVLDVTTRAVERMHALGARELRAWIGPSVCGSCYEVPAQMRAEVTAAVPATYSETRWGTPALDLGAGVEAQLAAADVTAVRVERCTLEDELLHSYRRDGALSGRIAGLVWIP